MVLNINGGLRISEMSVKQNKIYALVSNKKQQGVKLSRPHASNNFVRKNPELFVWKAR